MIPIALLALRSATLSGSFRDSVLTCLRTGWSPGFKPHGCDRREHRLRFALGVALTGAGREGWPLLAFLALIVVGNPSQVFLIDPVARTHRQRLESTSPWRFQDKTALRGIVRNAREERAKRKREPPG